MGDIYTMCTETIHIKERKVNMLTKDEQSKEVREEKGEKIVAANTMSNSRTH